MRSNKLAPVVLFVYNRNETLTKVINAIKLNKLSKKTELHIFSDGPKNNLDKIKILNIRSYLKNIEGFKKVTIYEREVNLGLSNNIINGVTKILNEYGQAIIIEDDILVSKFFLKYMNQALNFYKANRNVASIHGYQYPICFPKTFAETFFLKGADCWGWGTWKRAWKFFEKDSEKLYFKIKNNKKLIKEFNYENSYNFLKMLKYQTEGKIDSWAIRWYASAFLANMFTLYPKKSYVENIGFNNNGTHTNNYFYYNSKLQERFVTFSKVNIEENLIFRKKLSFFFIKRKYLRYLYFVNPLNLTKFLFKRFLHKNI